MNWFQSEDRGMRMNRRKERDVREWVDETERFLGYPSKDRVNGKIKYGAVGKTAFGRTRSPG